jgi:hypothetical protein
MKPHSLRFASGLTLLFSVLAAAGGALFEDPILAKGKGFEIRRTELDEITTGFRATAAGRGQNVPLDQMGLVENEMLTRLIQIRLLNLSATSKEKEEGSKVGEQRFEEHKKTHVSEEVFTSKLRSLGTTPERLKARLIEEAIGELVLNRDIRSQVTIKDEEVKKFYDDKPGLFEQPEKVKVGQILLATRGPSGLELPESERKAKREKLEDILKKARAGEDFAALIKLYSEDPTVRDNNGELTLTREGRFLEFEAAAFSLGPNQVSDIVTTPFGYHILKLLEKTPSKRTPFDEVSKNIKQKLEDDEVKKRLPDYFDKLKKEYNVEVLYKPPGVPAASSSAGTK